MTSRSRACTRARAPGPCPPPSREAIFVADLFCGAGGACRGIKAAAPEATVVGFDRAPQPEYPTALRGVHFQQMDVLRLRPRDVAHYDLLWLSPPCQRYSCATAQFRSRIAYPDLVGQARALAEAAGVPYVIENVPGAPLRRDLLLCGTMFPRLNVYRHRIFEIGGFRVVQPLHPTHRDPAGTRETVFGKRGPAGKRGRPRWRRAMGLGGLNVGGDAGGIYAYAGLAEAVPPAYARWIVANFLGLVTAPPGQSTLDAHVH